MSGLRWPLAALLSWLLAWAGFASLRALGASPGAALLGATLLGVVLALPHRVRWRRLIVAAGFPVSVLAQGWQAGLPAAWAWLWWLPLLLLWWLYPRRSWSEAPLFPTPRGALERLPEFAPLPPGARVLDAGCGLGHGLAELARVYPQARLEGVEWSRPLVWAARWRLRGRARVQRGDLWAGDWGGLALLYVFQRPETMVRLWAKAQRELPPGAWLASLDFEVPGQRPQAQWLTPGGRTVWLYRPQV